MNTSPTILRLAFAALLLLVGSACDLQKIGNQAAARTVAVSTLLTTPAVEVKGAAIAGNGFDAGLPSIDAGLLFDAGVFLDDAGFTIPAQNLAFVFFGKRQGDSPDSAPVGTAGASAKLIEVGGPSFALDDQGGGAYALSPDAGFVYRPNATYQFEFQHAAQTYTAEVEQVPAKETIDQFHPAAGYVELNAGESMSFIRPDPPQGMNRNFGFVNVIPISNEGAQGQPTYTNIPTTPLGFLKLLLAPTDWIGTNVVIPGTAFPNPDSNYIVVLQSAKLGGPKTDNLFSGSAILAGTADVAIIKTRK
ncbi:MAG: hypothetical protein Q8N23_34500 [Archangium sp.]|nr:hypothetical protein [Archangium sp.]MDP3571925.1 hypothetical protein [Archangium sp.]